jgi:Cache 3/Cache 2 fusion domain
VATNVKKDDGSRAIGTVLDPKGTAIAAIAKGETISERPTSWASLTSLAMNQSAMKPATSSASITSVI